MLVPARPAPFQIALDGAKADLAQTRLTLRRGEATTTSACCTTSARARRRSRPTRRPTTATPPSSAAATCRASNTTTPASSSTADTAALQSRAASRPQVQLAKLNGNPNVDVTDAALLSEGEGAVDEAQRQLDHTSRARALRRHRERGQLTAARHVSCQPAPPPSASSRPTMSGSTRNLKETELTYVKPGAPVDITVDTYPGCNWDGHVESICAGSGSSSRPCRRRMPAATGSRWCSASRCASPSTPSRATRPLRAGMSAVIAIDTGHAAARLPTCY